MSVTERGPGRMTYAKKKTLAEHDLRVTLQRAGNKQSPALFSKLLLLFLVMCA